MHLRTPKICISALLVAVVTNGAALRAEDAFFDIPLNELKVTEGELPKPTATGPWRRGWLRRDAMIERVVLDGPGEGYVTSDADDIQFVRSAENAPEQP